MKLSEEIVILFNGGIKDGKTNQTSSLNMKWIEACAFAKKIIEAHNDGTIIIEDRIITLPNGETEIYL